MIFGSNRYGMLKVFGGIVFSAGALAVLLVNVPPLTNCRLEVPSDQKEYRVQARETVVQPWKGRHQVYGIFEIPEQYRYDHLYSVKLTIQGFETEFIAGSSEDADYHTGIVKSGYYIKRVYVSTRAALWFLMTGRFGDLRTSCHWWLVLQDRGWKPTGSSE